MSRTVLELFRERAARHPAREAFRALAAGGAPADAAWTWGDWERDALQVAGALADAGHRPGERAAILAGNQPLWPIADLGILLAGLVSVGLYPTSAPAQVHRLLADAGATAVLVDSAEQLAKVMAVRSRLPALRTIVAPAGDAHGVASWAEWLAAGLGALDPASPLGGAVRGRIAAVRPEDTALLIYTSGSTGDPKGAMIPHRCLTASAESIRARLPIGEDDTTLSYLPYCHAGERVFGLYTRILTGASCGLVAEHGRLFAAAASYQPTVFGGLPRIYEKALESLGADPGSGVDAVFGTRVRLATSGGAALPRPVWHGLASRGLRIVGAYGLTEHLCAAMHRPGAEDAATVGPAMDGTTIRIAAGGEIQLRRSPLTFAGYLGDTEATRAAFTADGEWLRTGDLGELDQAGRLRITGRAKELIALSGGKKVAPLPIEAALAREPHVAQAMLFGEGRPYLVALLVPAAEARALGGAALAAALDRAVARVNAELSRPEQVKAWALADAEFTLDADELTPTLKLRRGVIAGRYRARLEALYR